MIARMRSLLIKSNTQNCCQKITIKLFTKVLLMLIGAMLLLTLTGCQEHFLGILNPKGIIAFKERKLLFDTTALMLIVVLPVIVMSFAFVYHYQISHQIRDYKPKWAHSHLLETIWWVVPCVIIVILAVITWEKTHELDPFNTIPGHEQQPPMVIQAIALPWKWLFIYPEEGIATINYLEIPVGQQVDYWLTTDNVPMSSFFIPQLGSQIFAMAGMRTQVHLVPSEIGVYQGLNTQYNGAGFSDMHFEVHVVDPAEMQKWVANVKTTPNILNDAAYHQLLNPSVADPPKFFTGVQPNFFNQVVMLYLQTFGNVHPRNNQAKMNNE